MKSYLFVKGSLSQNDFEISILAKSLPHLMELLKVLEIKTDEVDILRLVERNSNEIQLQHAS